MEARELRSGNIINQGKQYGIASIDAYNLYQLEQMNKGGVVAEYYKDWLPVALTEEWLKRAGFERNSDGTFVLIHIMYALPEMGVMQLAIGYSPLINCPCKYVHQLQNLYYALTGTELTIKG